jgi:hypothetical protein
VVPLGEKVKVFDLKKEKKSYAEVAKSYSKNEPPFILEIVKKEKEIHASFALTPQTIQVRSQCMVSA